jgi:hypothetical protein
LISPAALEEAVLALLLYHPEQSLKIASKLESSFIFTNRTNQSLAKSALEYVKKYNSAPGIQLEYLLENEIRRGEAGKLLNQQIQFLSKRVLEIDPSFVMDQLDRFIEVQHFQNSLQTALEHLERGDLEEARNAAFKNNNHHSTESPGIWINDPKAALSFYDRDSEEEYFSTGIPTLDLYGIRLDRKTLSFIIAAKGKGKSWYLVCVGKAGIQFHHKILHVTLEMSEQKTSLRYIQSIFALTKREAQLIKVPFFQKDPATGSTSIQFTEVQRDPILAKRSEVEKKLASMIHSQLLIKEFPTGMLSIEQLYMYLETLKREKGFEPDLLLVDYADLMKIDASNLRIDTGRLYKDLRGLAVSKDIALVTATQGNKESESMKVVQNTNVAEDWSKVATADLVLTYTQTPQEHLMNLARVFVANARDEADKFLVMLAQNYPCGQFVLDSIPMNVDISNQVKSLTGQ